MRRLLQMLCSALTAIALLLAIAVLVFWVRSYRVADVVEWRGWRFEQPIQPQIAANMYENNGFLRSQNGYLTLWRRRQQIEVELPVGQELEKSNPRKGPTWTSFPARNGDILFSSNDPPGTFWERAGFYYRVRTGRSPTTLYYDCAVPFWAILALPATPPALWLARWRSRRRRKWVAMNQCVHCGYDLRATPARCPECGLAKGAV
jgi:hypothetical protein